MDALLTAADRALRTVFASHHASRPTPGASSNDFAVATPLTEAQKQEAAALMRVNHVGEVCAQALYTAQALATRDNALRAHLLAASDEETANRDNNITFVSHEPTSQFDDQLSWLSYPLLAHELVNAGKLP